MYKSKSVAIRILVHIILTPYRYGQSILGLFIAITENLLPIGGIPLLDVGGSIGNTTI